MPLSPAAAGTAPPPAAARAVRPMLLGAALALPGVAPTALADTLPERQVGFRWLHYRDAQPGLDRIRVNSPSAWFVTPLGDTWSAAGSLGVDAVSGASPAWHAAISSASRISDRRTAGDWRLTRHAARSRWTLGAVHSDERDYRSRALSFEASVDDEAANTTWSLSTGFANDRLEPVAGRPGAGTRRAADVLASVTRVASPVDIVQLALGAARYTGDLSDPYKALDRRPDDRTQGFVQLRWNHHVDGGALDGSTFRTSYRHYRDDWGVRAHTASFEWVRPLPGGWSVTPLARFHTQSAARFYYDPVYDPVLGEPFPPGLLAQPAASRSSDTRLSAFGAATLGVRIEAVLPAGWHAELRMEWYRQSGDWRIGGTGSPGLPPLDARIVQAGLRRTF